MIFRFNIQNKFYPVYFTLTQERTTVNNIIYRIKNSKNYLVNYFIDSDSKTVHTVIKSISGVKFFDWKEIRKV